MGQFKLTSRQTQLFAFVKQQHGDQKRKYTGAPYWTHLLRVAEIVQAHHPEAVEMALCHDLLEDTNCTEEILLDNLMENNYSEAESSHIVQVVVELTDVYTNTKFPSLKRTQRKQMESERLGNISPLAQSVKYADLIDNTSSIVEYDLKFAKVYLKEKRDILKLMRKGNATLLKQCESQLRVP